MRLPSIKTLDSAFPGKGKELRRILESSKAAALHPSAVKYDNACYNKAPLFLLRLIALNAVAETHGHEYVRRGSNKRSPGFYYLNTGDTYAATIIRFDNGRYAVSDIGTIIERGNYE